MKSKLLCFVILMALTISMVSNSIAGDRRVIVERFTSSTCPPCATYNPTLDAFLNATNVNDLISISYHMNWPAPGNDPMFLANPNDNNARRANYNVNSIPNWKFDGVININGFGTGELQSSLSQRKDILSPISMIVKETRNGNTVNAVVEILQRY